MRKYIVSFVFFLSIFVYSQQGVNYKALIKDNLGNVVSNDLIQVQFSILQGVAQTNVYEETHSPTTTANGMIIISIGEGTVISGDFNTIDWSSDTHFLNVQINTGSGLEDMGTTEFKAVPYAKHAETAANVTGLEKITEGGVPGWRLIGMDPAHYGDIGDHAVDLSISGVDNIPYGALGTYSVAMGFHTRALSTYSTAMGYLTLASESSATAFGDTTTASGENATSMGEHTEASGRNSTAMGYFSEALGRNSTAMGRSTIASSYTSTSIGRYNIGGGDAANWVDTDPLFEVGNGTSNSNRNNALTIEKSGEHIINSSRGGLQINAVYGGIRINSSSTGIAVSEPSAAGISVSDAGFHGIVISNPNDNGINISDAGLVGIFASGNIYGARFFGDEAGVYASGDQSVEGVPDIILGSSNFSSFSDDGIISTNPERSGSDMFLRSYDAVVVELDYDNNETGHFRVRNGAQTIVFDVNESGNATLAGSLTQNSDRRLKTNIKDLSYGLNEVLKLKPRSYHWKDRAKEKKSLGLIAQDVQGIISEIVNTQDDEAKTLGISYNELIPVLIKAIQEQQVIINTQNKRINVQDKNYEAILSRIEKLESNQAN